MKQYIEPSIILYSVEAADLLTLSDSYMDDIFGDLVNLEN